MNAFANKVKVCYFCLPLPQILVIMPKLNGIELRSKVHENEDLRMKSIPFLFFSTAAEQQHVVEAYSKSVQGFFIKPSEFSQMVGMIKNIVEYWQSCVSPNYIK